MILYDTRLVNILLTAGERCRAVCTRLRGRRETRGSLWPAMCRPHLWDAPLLMQAVIAASGA
jgi:hypothetical protein